MKELAIAACTALVAGAALGGSLKLPDMASAPSPDVSILVGEDPNMALHRVAMGAESWTAPPPFLRIAAFSTPTVTDTVDADLAEWQAQSHADNESARIAYVRDTQAYAYTPVARTSEPPALAQAEAPAPNLPYIAPVDLVSLDSDGPRG